MPTKTDRILSYLPSTFRALPKPTALHSIVDAFGGELLQAENSLAALMLAHWVDHADRGEELIQDLACIASLYGLGPRGAQSPGRNGEKCLSIAADESVKEFREHLKRYVRTFLEGTVTVQGILRVTAESLGLRINDDYIDLDTWWTRESDALVDVAPRGDDAARLLLGIETVDVHGHPPEPARIEGQVDLSGEIDLGEGLVLHLKVDNAGAVKIEMPRHAKLDAIAQAINLALLAQGPDFDHVATHEANRLALTSPTAGPASRIEILDAPDDAALKLLGIPPRVYHGSAATRAQVSSLHFDGPVDLSESRFLRLSVDGSLLAEVDCAARSADKKHAKPEDIAKAINEAFSKAALGDAGLDKDLATAANGVLTITSPTEGSASSIILQSAAAQDARQILFGAISTSHSGSDARPAAMKGLRDLSGGVDLSTRSLIRLKIDDLPPVTIDCVGAVPAATFPSEITDAINDAIGVPLATHDGRFISFISKQTGPAAQLRFETLPEEQDATAIIFGIIPRSISGALAASARLVGTPDLSRGVNLGALNKLRLAIDGSQPKEVDLRSRAAKPTVPVSPAEIAKAIDAAFGEEIASDDGNHLIIGSPIAGSASSITVTPIEVKRRRRFVTRAFVSDEAGPKLFGFSTRRRQGSGATRMRITGAKDLSRGVDLRVARYLRLKIDDQQAIEIDCAGQRPRVTELKEIVATINKNIIERLGLESAAPPPIASSPDNQRLRLTSPRSGAAGGIVFEEPRGVLALLGFEPGLYRGGNTTGVNFVGTVDLSKGVDLSAGSTIKLGANDKQPVEIDCAKKGDPQHTSLNDIVDAINAAMGAQVARSDDNHIVITSPAGANSRVEFALPAAGDATKKIFGIIAPRVYLGAQDAPARVTGSLDLSVGIDLRGARTLRLAVNGEDPVEIDCSTSAAAPQPEDDGSPPIDPRASVKLPQLVLAINNGFIANSVDAEVKRDGSHLRIESKTKGSAARLELLIVPQDDARQTFFGEMETTPGSDPTPARIVGEADLISPVNLAARSVIKIAVNGNRPIEIDVGGSAPQNTLLGEAVARINSIVPGLASATDDNHLALTSPIAGDESSLELLPTGSLEVIEYPPAAASFPQGDDALKVRHGDSFVVNNGGAAESDLQIEVFAPHGAAKPAFVNRSTNQIIRLNETLRPGDRAEVWSDGDGNPRARITAADGERRDVPRTHITCAPLGLQATVPFTGTRTLARNGDGNPSMLILRNPLAPSSLLLRARGGEASGVTLSVTEAKLAATQEALSATGQHIKLPGRVRVREGEFWLVDANDKTIARLRVSVQLELKEYLDRVVAATGTLHQIGDEQNPEMLLVVEGLTELFDVKVQGASSDGEKVTEEYPGVTIGHGAETDDSLARQINFGDSRSRLVHADEASHGASLILPRGQSHWSYLDCGGARFDQAWFNHSVFAGIVYEPCAELPAAECRVRSFCEERGIFDVSRFVVPASADDPQKERVIFTTPRPLNDPPVEIRLRWNQHQPGAFIVNLPADLPEQFGARFDRSRFASAVDADEKYLGVVTEPADDPDYIVNRLAGSRLVKASIAGRVEIGFLAVPLPIGQPRRRKLSGGNPDEAARIYLSEKDVSGFIKLSARRDGELSPGAWGNEIVVSARKSEAGPARFDVTISYQGGRFENARQVARGGDVLPARIEDFLRPGAVGVLQAKAAGIHAEVTRDRAHDLD